jgi:hypothetical protein
VSVTLSGLAKEPVAELKMPRRVFTPATIRIIRNLANEGKSSAEIAHLIGSTSGSVRIVCCHLKIRLLTRRRHSSAVPNLGERRLLIYMRPDDYIHLERQAALRQKSAAEYAGMLLQAIVRADIYDAVLDE